MNEIRRKKLESRILTLMSDLYLKELRNQSDSIVTFTGVNVNRDATEVRVLVSVYGDEEDQKKTLVLLRKARGFFAARIGKIARLSVFPRVYIDGDHSSEGMSRIDNLQDEQGRYPASIKPSETPDNSGG